MSRVCSQEAREGNLTALPQLASRQISPSLLAALMDGSYVLPTAPAARRKTSASPVATPTPASPDLTPVDLKAEVSESPELTRRQRIESAVKEKDLEQLKRLAAEVGGFESSELRRRVWWVLARLVSCRV